MRVWVVVGVFVSLLPLAAASAAPQPNENQGAEALAATSKTLTSGFIKGFLREGALRGLCFDATGSGLFAGQTPAGFGAMKGMESVCLEGRRLTLTPSAQAEWRWELPFLREGYYDADLHINYPSPLTTAGAIPYVFPFRRFVSSVGQISPIECFKRMPAGFRTWSELSQGGQLLLCGDAEFNFDLKLTLPGRQSLVYEIGETSLTLIVTPGAQPITLEVLPRGLEEVPSGTLVHPQARFEPEFLATFEPTNKSVPASPLMTELLRTGMYWFPTILCVGDWGLDAVGTLSMEDPRSWYLKILREQLSDNLTQIGYDRFEHFGLMFAWGRLPDYGAGALLNLPPGNALFDMRMVHLNGQYIQTVASYVLATGDVSFLKARRARWLATDGQEPQPLCGAKAKSSDFVLAAGDVRLDGKAPQKVHTLGQSFIAKTSFHKILIRLGNESRKETASGKALVRRQPGGPLLHQQPFTLAPGFKDALVIGLPQTCAPGSYFVEISDDDSGRRYFGPGIYWLTDREADNPSTPAASGPFQGNNYDRLKLLFTYIMKYTGAAREHLSYYQNNLEFNGPEHKAGRHGNTSQDSFWENIGGGYDAYEGLWFNAACDAMAQMAELMGEPADARRYQDLRHKADQAYNKKYWHEVEENGRRFGRYFGCQDWDGVIHDFGFTHNNLEAAERGIPSPEQTRAILWWLDRGQWRTDLDRPWQDHIYSIWEIAPPFNTTGNTTWLGPTGTLPYRHVLSNGGTRPITTARDLYVRAKYLSVDNMHERNEKVLGRFASPDRLTGGRTFPDPGGRGRWHFGEPYEDRADIEGFREIFQINGTLGTHEVMAYLGMDYTANGLRLRPRVPSELERMSFEGIGYWGALFDFHVEARREEVKPAHAAATETNTLSFSAAARFNKAGVRARIRPFKVRRDAQMSLTLERRADGRWEEVGRNWMNHVQDGQWVWVAVEEWLAPGGEYRLLVHDLCAPAGEAISLEPATEGSGPALRLVAERTRLGVNVAMNQDKTPFSLLLRRGKQMLPATMAETVMDPGEWVMLSPGKVQRP